MKYCLSLIAIAVVLFSCTSAHDKAMNKISALEKSIIADSAAKTLDKNKARELIEAYVDFSKLFSKDEKSAEFLFKAGDLANGMRIPMEALEYYSQVYMNYPDSPKAPLALFLQGFINENYIHNVQKAKSIYEEFLKKYPTHQMAKDAQFSLDHLGMSDEELIRMFEEKNKGEKVN